MEGPSHAASERLDAVFAGARDGLFDWDLATDAIRFSPRWKDALGFATSELEDRPEEWFRRVHPRDLDPLKRAIDAHVGGRSPALEHEFRMLHKDGAWRWFLVRAVKHPACALIGGSLTDVTAIKSTENRLLQAAFFDPLTGLANEDLFLERMELALSRQRRRGERATAVLYLDLDRFHDVNDSLGVNAGDALLVEIKDRLLRLLRLGDTLARFGGDEFGFLLDGVEGEREAQRFAEEVLASLKAPSHLHGLEVFSSASLGIAVATTGCERAEDLLRDAITAMHRAKETDAISFALFDPRMNERAKERLRLEADLHRALEKREFELHYQPIVCFRSGSLAGFEALVRWRHPERGMIRPDVFVPIAEETGQIVPLGRWVLGEACRQAREWRERFASASDLSVAVNLSARQFEDPELVECVRTALRSADLDPRALELEMTESVVMARTSQNRAVLQSLRDLGLELLIDDFGTGYSSLACLSSFPLDSLKIDRSFVMGMEYEGGKAEIVRTILALAKTLGLDVVAEGIETAEALAMLRHLECGHGQGFFFSGAVDPVSAAAWIESPPRW
jgi:diguanylate cyclase (GGDEF)-like protein/PAS domain S-box-containing protein